MTGIVAELNKAKCTEKRVFYVCDKLKRENVSHAVEEFVEKWWNYIVKNMIEWWKKKKRVLFKFLLETRPSSSR